jgi:hypothetical protein
LFKEAADFRVLIKVDLRQILKNFPQLPEGGGFSHLPGPPQKQGFPPDFFAPFQQGGVNMAGKIDGFLFYKLVLPRKTR